MNNPTPGMLSVLFGAPHPDPRQAREDMHAAVQDYDDSNATAAALDRLGDRGFTPAALTSLRHQIATLIAAPNYIYLLGAVTNSRTQQDLSTTSTLALINRLRLFAAEPSPHNGRATPHRAATHWAWLQAALTVPDNEAFSAIRHLMRGAGPTSATGAPSRHAWLSAGPYGALAWCAGLTRAEAAHTSTALLTQPPSARSIALSDLRNLAALRGWTLPRPHPTPVGDVGILAPDPPADPTSQTATSAP